MKYDKKFTKFLIETDKIKKPINFTPKNFRIQFEVFSMDLSRTFRPSKLIIIL